MPHRLVNIYCSFGGNSYPEDGSIRFHQTTWHKIPEDSNIHIHCYVNIKPYIHHFQKLFSPVLSTYFTGHNSSDVDQTITVFTTG
jgi:hypothetical protein